MAEVQDRAPVTTAPDADMTTAHTRLAVEGMTCASCARRVERGLLKVPGVTEASVNLATERATVAYDPALASLDDLLKKVEAVGYAAAPLRDETARSAAVAEPGAAPTDESEEREPERDEAAERRQAELTRRRNTLLLGVALSIPVVVLSMFFMDRFPGENWLLLALTAPVWGYVGWEFHHTALRVVRHFGANMDVLVSLGST